MNSLTEHAHTWEIELTDGQLSQFDNYYRELIDWNARMNLTAITEHDQVVVKHFLDALSIVPVLARETKRTSNGVSVAARLIDIGTGAGLPGIPLKIVLPSLRLTLLETTGKKVQFLQHVIAQLHLDNAVAIQARAEDLGRQPDHRAQYNVAVARAVANLATLAEYALPFVRQGGVFIAQKGVDIGDELGQAAHAVQVLGGRVREIVPVQLPGLERRHLIVIEKISATPGQYPRRAGIPKRQPLTN